MIICQKIILTIFLIYIMHLENNFHIIKYMMKIIVLEKFIVE